MVNFYESFNDISIINYITIYIALAIAINFIQLFLKNLFLNQRIKKKRNEIIEAFRTNKTVIEYIQEYKKIEYITGSLKLFIFQNIGVFVGFFTPFIVAGSLYFIFIDRLYFNVDEPHVLMIFVYTILITSCISVIGIFLINVLVKKSIINETLLDKHVTFANIYIFLIFYTMFQILVELLFVNIILVNWDKISNLRETYTSITMVSISLMLISPFLYFISIRFFKAELKHFINKTKKTHFPILKVTTKESTQIEGQIIDIFNEKVIILEDQNIEKIVSWDSVSSLEIESGNNKDDTNQKYLYDYL